MSTTHSNVDVIPYAQDLGESVFPALAPQSTSVLFKRFSFVDLQGGVVTPEKQKEPLVRHADIVDKARHRAFFDVFGTGATIDDLSTIRGTHQPATRLLSTSIEENYSLAVTSKAVAPSLEAPNNIVAASVAVPPPNMLIRLPVGQLIRTVEVWIAAFIPNNLSGQTKKITKGIHAGKTALAFPDPNGSFSAFSKTFLDDQRTFSANGKTASRMYTHLTFDAFSGAITQKRLVNGTTGVDLKTGKVVCSTTPNKVSAEYDSLLFRKIDGFVKANQPYGTQTGLTFKIDAFARNHCLPSPYIDFQGFLDIDVLNSFKPGYARSGFAAISFNGEVDDFPAYEAYTSVNGLPAQRLFGIAPKPGVTPAGLLGDAYIPVGGNKIFTNGNIITEFPDDSEVWN